MDRHIRLLQGQGFPIPIHVSLKAQALFAECAEPASRDAPVAPSQSDGSVLNLKSGRSASGCNCGCCLAIKGRMEVA